MRTPTLARTVPETLTQNPAGLTFLAVEPNIQSLPAGSTVAFELRNDPVAELIRYWVDGLPCGITAHFLVATAPY